MHFSTQILAFGRHVVSSAFFTDTQRDWEPVDRLAAKLQPPLEVPENESGFRSVSADTDVWFDLRWAPRLQACQEVTQTSEALSWQCLNNVTR